MFTGLTESIGYVKSLKKRSDGLELVINDPFVSSNTKTGDSVSVDGVCLTIVSIEKEDVKFDVSLETAKRTIIDGYRLGTAVNCELAMRFDSRMGGHFVTGHIDTVGFVKDLKDNGSFLMLDVEFDRDFSLLVVEKGSIAINGVSLTINKTGINYVSIMLIPHTIQKTNLKFLKRSSRVNIEFDIIGKYINRYISRNGGTDDRLRRLLEEGEL